MRILRIYTTDNTIDVRYKTDLITQDQENFTVMDTIGLDNHEKELGIRFLQIPHTLSEFKNFCSTYGYGLSVQTIGSPSNDELQVLIEPTNATTLEGLVVTPNPVNLTTLGSTQQLVVMGTYDDESVVDVTDQVVYVSGDDGVATVSNTGLVTAIANGEATITVSLNGISDNTTVTVATE